VAAASTPAPARGARRAPVEPGAAAEAQVRVAAQPRVAGVVQAEAGAWASGEQAGARASEASRVPAEAQAARAPEAEAAQPAEAVRVARRAMPVKAVLPAAPVRGAPVARAAMTAAQELAEKAARPERQEIQEPEARQATPVQRARRAQAERRQTQAHEMGQRATAMATTTTPATTVGTPMAAIRMPAMAGTTRAVIRMPATAVAIAAADFTTAGLYDDRVRRPNLVLLGLANALGACGGSSSLPLDVEVKDGAAVAGGKWDEIQLVVKSLPGAEIQFGTETKNMEATRAVEQFRVPKSSLKLGKNAFVVRAKITALLSKREAEKKVEWDVEPKTLLRFEGSPKGDAEALSCVGAMCGQPTVKATKNGHLPLQVESAIGGTLTVGASKITLSPGQKAELDLDLLPLVAARNVGELAQLTVPFSFEAGGAKADDAFELGGAALSDFVARTFAQAEQSPLTFSGEKAATNPKPAMLLVVGAPIRKFIAVGTPAKFADVDLVGVAKKAERQVACAADSEIVYNDLEIRVVDRRTAKTIGMKKLRADRVSCPPTPSGKLMGEVREDDVKRVLSEFLSK